MSKEEKDALCELNHILALYKPEYKILEIAGTLAVFAIGIIVVMTIGEFWGIILLVIAGAAICLDASRGKHGPTDLDLSMEACRIMSFCVHIRQGDDPLISRYSSCAYGLNGNLSLYNKFISFYPNMACFKLKSLASKKPKW